MKNNSVLWSGRIAVYALGLLASSPVFAADTYNFDKAHTEIRVSWNHVGISTQSLVFKEFDGTFVIDSKDPTKSSADVSINASSVSSTVAVFEGELRSANFFDTEKFPKITFKSTAVRQVGKNSVEITGDLTIKDVTKSVKLDAELLYNGTHPLGPYIAYYKDAQYTGFKAKTQVLRSDFGLGAFAPLTSDRVVIEINTELRRK